jgi:hypothetical protein
LTTQIVPSLGAGILETQQGVGSAPGYAAIDDRRMAGFALLQGLIGSAYGGGAASGAYAVTQRQAGANMSVDIAASTGGGIAVAGTTVGNQGLYIVPPHSAVINEAISTADPTNPRVDQLIVQTFDNTIDSSTNNKAQVTVLAGTPTAGATIGITGNRNGAAALPANSYRLADVLVPAAAASITNANVFDRRPKTRGHSNTATSESRTNTAYGLLPTPDQVTEIVLPTDGLIAVAFQATCQESSLGQGQAALFLNGTQVKLAATTTAAVAETFFGGSSGANIPRPLFSYGAGITSGPVSTSSYGGDATTGQIVGGTAGQIAGSPVPGAGGPCYIFAAAGTYHVSVQFKAAVGSVTIDHRKLWVWTMAPDQGVLA